MIHKEFPLITVGLLTYNNSETIERALDGLIRQSYPNYEILVFDDCSQDNTAEILKKYSQIKLNVNPKNIGIMKNIELLFRNVEGKYFLWACPDDAYSPELLTRCFHTIHNTNYVAALPQVRLIFNGDESICSYQQIPPNEFLNNSKLFLQSILYRTKGEQYCFYWHSLMRTEIIKKLIPFKPSYFSIEELFSIFLIMQGGITTAPEILWEKYQSSVPLKERIKEAYDIVYGLKNKLLCIFAWMRLYLKYDFKKTPFFLATSFKFLFYSYYCRIKNILYITLKAAKAKFI